MGLPASQRKVLDRLDSALRASDPRLAALFAIFSRLTRDEEMPRIEQLRARTALVLLQLHRRWAAARHWLGTASMARRRAVLIVPLAVLAVASIFAMAAALPRSAAKCPRAFASVGVARRSASGKTCAPPMLVFAR